MKEPVAVDRGVGEPEDHRGGTSRIGGRPPPPRDHCSRCAVCCILYTMFLLELFEWCVVVFARVHARRA